MLMVFCLQSYYSNIVPGNQCQKVGLEQVYESNLLRYLRNKVYVFARYLYRNLGLVHYPRTLSLSEPGFQASGIQPLSVG